MCAARGALSGRVAGAGKGFRRGGIASGGAIGSWQSWISRSMGGSGFGAGWREETFRKSPKRGSVLLQSGSFLQNGYGMER